MTDSKHQAPGKTGTDRVVESVDTDVVKQSFQNYKRVKKDYSGEQLDYIIKTIAPGLIHDEAILFILRCEKLSIDPMSGDITAYASGQGDKRKLVMIVSRNFKRERGMSNPHVKSVEVKAIYTKEETEISRTFNANAVIGETDKGTPILQEGEPEVVQKEVKKLVRAEEWEAGKLWGAMCTIVRDDYTKPFQVIVPFSEYKGWNVWESKPSTMIKKVAESQCWDLAVPELSRVYDESERFDEGQTGETAMKDGGEPATAEQISTIKTLRATDNLGDLDYGSMTKQEAAQEIKKLSSKKK